MPPWLKNYQKRTSVKFPNLKALQNHVPQTGQLDWIGCRPGKKQDMVAWQEATVTKDAGIEGDHYRRKDGKRQVTLIQQEHLVAVGQLLGTAPIDPRLTRRNLVISGINLLALKGKAIRIGAEVKLEITGDCHPCSRMEENLGDGGYSAMRGHGGVTARVLSGGQLQVGDPVQMIHQPKEQHG